MTEYLDRELLAFGQRFHGHKCPAMPMGLRTGLAALRALGVERAPDKQLMALIELDDDQCSTCWADGIQVTTGCTFGKGNIKKLYYGKWVLTLIDKATQRAVRVALKTEMMQRSKQSEFMKQRQAGVPASQIPASVSEPLIEMVVSTPDERMLTISDVFTYVWKDSPLTFDSTVCESCGELVVTKDARSKDGKTVCIPCSGYGK
jgi:formylmethanofuran dehydrogenase subunit E